MSDVAESSGLTAEQQQWVDSASRDDTNGWIYLRVSGEPFARGFAHGYLTADEFEDAIRVYTYMTYQTMGMEYSFFVENAVKMHKDKIPAEILEEMEGLAAGFTAAGVPTNVDDIIGWNAWMEVTGYWWPTVASKYANDGPKGTSGGHCSAFVATGSATPDGKFVIGHTSFDEFWSGQYFNLLLDLTPPKGHRMVMQSVPGYVGSFTDFWMTGAGLAITETTLAGFHGYDETRVPEYVRSRTACQYANTIDEWVELMNKDNNGGYANAWLLADTKTNEIARYEEGLIYQDLQKKTDGYFFGCNAIFDPRIRNLEGFDTGFSDPRQQTGSRRIRWMQLLEQHSGQITAEIGRDMLADTFDPYLGYENPSSRNICAHYDNDPQYYAGDPAQVWNIPFYPAGSCDGKVASADDVAKMSMWGRVGRADGVKFDVDEFLRAHPQWNWQRGYLKSRPSQPWVYFDNGTLSTTL